jgi:hypothetical protein
MPFMGFDREHLQSLRRSMRRAAAELAAVRSDDPDARESVATARSVCAVLTFDWLPVIDAILTCVALDDGGGWQVIADPLPGPGGVAVTADEARELVAWLLGDHLEGAVSNADLVRLADTLDAIAGDRALTGAFRDAIGDDHHWARLLDHVGIVRAGVADVLSRDPHDGALATSIAALDRALGALATTYASGPHDGHHAWYPTVVQYVEPYTAALLITHLDLGSRMLAAVSDDVLRRWFDAGFERQWADQYYGGDNAADLLFVKLAADPVAAAAFLLRTADRPELVLLTAQHDHHVEALLVTGTSPTNMSAADAGRVIVPMIAYVRAPGWQFAGMRDGVTGSAPAILGGVVAPWLLQFGPRAAQWHWSADDGDDAIRWLIDDPAAAEHLLTAVEQWSGGSWSTGLIADDGSVRAEALHDLAAMVVHLDLAFRDAEITAGAEARLWTSIGVVVAELVVPALFTNPAVGLGVDVAVTALSPAVGAALRRNGVLPANEDEARRSADDRFGSRLTETAVVAVMTTVGHLVDAGQLRPEVLERLDLTGVDGSCPAAETNRRLREFVMGLEGDLDPLTFESLLIVTDVFAGPVIGPLACT